MRLKNLKNMIRGLGIAFPTNLMLRRSTRGMAMLTPSMGTIDIPADSMASRVFI